MEIEIEVQELTVGQVDDLLADMEGDAAVALHICDLLYPDRMPFSIVRIVTGLPEAAFKEMTPTEYEAVLEAAESKNPILVAGLKRLAAVGKTLLTRKGLPTSSA